MDSSSDNPMIAMEEEEEVPVAKRLSIRIPMEGVAKRIDPFMERSSSRSEFDKLEDRIWKLKTEYHQRKRTELDQVADIWIDIKKSKEEGHISTEKMQALMSHFRSLLREVAAYSDQEKELIQIGYRPIKWVTAEKDISALFIESFPMVAYETNGTGGAATSSGGLIIPYMLKHFVRFIIFAVLSYAALYLLLPDDGGRGITHVVPFWMMAFQVYFMAIIVYSYFHRSE